MPGWFGTSKPTNAETWQGVVLPGSTLPGVLLDLGDVPIGWMLETPPQKFNKNDPPGLRPGGVVVPFSVMSTEIATRSFELSANGPWLTFTATRYAPGIARSLLDQWDAALRNYPTWKQRQLGAYSAQVRASQVSFPAIGDRTSAWRFSMDAQAKGMSGTIATDIVRFQVGESLGSVSNMAESGPPDTRLTAELAAKFAERFASVGGASG